LAAKRTGGKPEQQQQQRHEVEAVACGWLQAGFRGSRTGEELERQQQHLHEAAAGTVRSIFDKQQELHAQGMMQASSLADVAGGRPFFAVQPGEAARLDMRSVEFSAVLMACCIVHQLEELVFDSYIGKQLTAEGGMVQQLACLLCNC
jgi:hypothetical protein